MSDPYEYPNGNPGGFINPKHGTKKAKEQKVKWTAANDQKLIPYIIAKENATFEYAIIASKFPENPTPKAIQERIVKLRAESRKILAEDGIFPFNPAKHPTTVPQEEESNASETPGPEDPTDTSMASGTPNSTGNVDPNAGINSMFQLKHNKNAIPSNKRKSSMVIDDETTQQNLAPAAAVSMGPPPKKARFELTTISTGEKPKPNADWMGPSVKKASAELGAKYEARIAAEREAENGQEAPGEQEGGTGVGLGAGGDGEAGLLM